MRLTDRQLDAPSYYADTAPRGPAYPPLASAHECDVAIVGGGLAGLSAAIELAQRGYAVCVLEAQQVGWGASGRNGGQAIAGLACDQSVIEAQVGPKASRAIWDMTLEAIALIHQRRERFGIDCDWRAGFLNVATNPRKAQALRAWHTRMQSHYGYATTWIDPEDLAHWIASPRYCAGVHDPLGGHLHPLKYCLGLAHAAHSLGVHIHEGSAVRAMEPGAVAQLHTADGRLRARHVLLAGNVYLQGLAPSLQRRIMPVGTYISASEPLDPELAHSLIPSGAAVCDTNVVLDYFRLSADHRLLYGGRVSYSTATPARLGERMRRRMVGTFPQLHKTRVDYTWGGFVDITMNRAPDFGRLGGPLSNVYYLQGFSGHGLALTGLAGRLVAEAIAGSAERFDVFSRLRHRAFPGGPLLRTPALVLGMAYHRLKDLL